jgi:hypothetical protein
LTKPNGIARYTLKYIAIDSTMREQYRQAWNQPIVWPLTIALLLFILLCLPAAYIYWKKIHRPLSLKKISREA